MPRRLNLAHETRANIPRVRFADIKDAALGKRYELNLIFTNPTRIKKLNKIYPLRICDIRHFSLERFVTAVDIRKIKEELARVKKAKVEIKVEEEEPVEQAAPVQEAAEAQN